MLRKTRLVPFLFCCAFASGAAGEVPSPRQGEAFARALTQAQAGAWAEAEAAAERGVVAAGVGALRWMRLREGTGSWEDYAAFLARGEDWPNSAAVRRGAERVMPADLPAEQVLAFFGPEQPMTGTGVVRYAAALEAEGRAGPARAEVRRAWRRLSLGLTDQETLLGRYRELVLPLTVERLDMLLWRGLTAEAAALLPLVPEDWQALAKARIAVRKDADGTTAMIAALPTAMQADPGLAFERYLYRVREGRWDEAEEFLLARSTSEERLGQPDAWMERRANLARMALRRGEAETAYALAAGNFGTSGSGADYADAEWVAGFVALTALDDPARAAEHFRRFGAAVRTPISLGRAGYWLGLAEARVGNVAEAEAAFREGARHQTSFYGQLAAQQIGLGPDPHLAGEPAEPQWRGQAFLADPVVQAGALYARAGDDVHAAQMLRHAAAGLDAAGQAALAQMAIDLGLPHVAVRLGKDAAARGLIVPNTYYPLHAMAETDWPVPREFALAIARQES